MQNTEVVSSCDFLESLYAEYRQGQAVPDAWQKLFVQLEKEGAGIQEASLLAAHSGPLVAHLDPLKLEPPVSFEGREGVWVSSCGTLAVEGHGAIGCDFLQEQVLQPPSFSSQEKQRHLFELTSIDAMEKFLHQRFIGVRRFSIEGADATIKILEVLLQEAPLEEMVIGMAHRGRINVLTNFMGKAIETVFAAFLGFQVDLARGADSGDVKYHMGFSTDRQRADGRSVHISLAFNPSHLEAVVPVVQGSTWARQKRAQVAGSDKILPVTVHGDAAFAGQGVVYETLQMSQLAATNVGGTVRILLDNQVGFTTNPKDSRSTVFASDVCRTTNTPVVHVNGDDVEACVHAARIAWRYRYQYHRDIVVRLVGYRRHGHNEGDEPTYTQPLMYERIKKHPSLREIYGKQLLEEGVLTVEAMKEMWSSKIKDLTKILAEVKKSPPTYTSASLGRAWSGLRGATKEELTSPSVHTHIESEVANRIVESLTPPSDFDWHPKLQKQYMRLIEAYKKEGHCPWVLGEILAYGSLICQGHDVHLLGQDAIRGTFSHRHAMYVDSQNEKIYNPLGTLNPGVADLYVYNSLLSEEAALGFEYGLSIASPNTLTIWEAQFGDFANGAQVMIDQFIVAAEAKWNQMSGLVLLLPHGYEGQGPEHSSARLERFLASCVEGNIQVVQPTTPAQIFHVLRRQVLRDFRKPLVVMSPKSLLRHPKVVSHISDMISPKGFAECLVTQQIKNEAIERVLLCTGKVYYDLLAAYEKQPDAHKNMAIWRLEQIYPFAHWECTKRLKSYVNVKSMVWVQEEPENMGAYPFISAELTKGEAGTLGEEMQNRRLDLHYVGRPACASPATGSTSQHQQEQEKLISEAMSGAHEL